MPDIGEKYKLPSGLILRDQIPGHEKEINQIVWSQDGHLLASLSNDGTIRIWNADTRQLYRMRTVSNSQLNTLAWSPDGWTLALEGVMSPILWNIKTNEIRSIFQKHIGLVRSIAWSPDGQILASGSDDKTVRLWNVETGELLRVLIGHHAVVNSLLWSPDGQVLASASYDGTIRLWDKAGELLQTLTGHTGMVNSVAWSLNGRILASSSNDLTIRLWDPSVGRHMNTLEGHTDAIINISFSCDTHLLASRALDGTIRFWRTDTWEFVSLLNESQPKEAFSNKWNTGLAFHPNAPILATLDEENKIISIWDVDSDLLLSATAITPSVHYTNAKIVLVGDSGVGKTGLGLVLTGQPFAPTESSHARRVWTFNSQEVELDDGRRETRETLLWDLAGQPGYRLIHQLHLNEVAVALVVFDARSETDPFMGVRHWERALRLALRIQGNSAPPMKKLLIAARIDRGGRSVSRTRIEALVEELGFDDYFETSAKEGWNVTVVAEAILHAIDWKVLPKVSSTDLFQRIKAFLVAEKEAERLLSTAEDLYRAFLLSKHVPLQVQEDDLRTQFETCIGRVESRGLIRRLSFGNFVLLQPEMLDSYASSLINAVRDEPDGLGSILEEKAQKGQFTISGECLEDKVQEKLLLIAMVEDLLRHEIALREPADDGPHLVFPSQSTRERPDLPDPEGKTVLFRFEGSVLNIYATLAVRLSHSGMFSKKEMWKNAVTYTARAGGTCGISLHNEGEGQGELILFFDNETSEETRYNFEEYVQIHLQRRGLPDSIHRERIFLCPDCTTPFTSIQVLRRREHGFKWIKCSVCETIVSLLDREERLTKVQISVVTEMDRAADIQREREAAASVLQGKIETDDFDVFLCYNNEDQLAVKKVGERLKERGILPWLDEWELQPGLPWQRLLEQQIAKIKSAAVFVGKKGIGPWQRQELEAILREFVARNCPVIPVILADTPIEPELPIFLKGMTWIDLRRRTPDPLNRLIWGITGKHS